MTDVTQHLQEACAPFFLFLATFRRNAQSSSLDIADLSALLQRELERVQESCKRDVELAPMFERVRYALVTTADQVVLSSPWSNRAGWSMQLLEATVYGSREGGKRFFDLVEEVLADSSDKAPALATVLFHCMGLGFQGALRSDKSKLQALRQRLYDKSQLPGRMGDKLTPDAYGKNSTKGAMKLPTVGIFRFVIVAIAAVVFALSAGKAVTKWKTRSIDAEIETLSERIAAPVRE